MISAGVERVTRGRPITLLSGRRAVTSVCRLSSPTIKESVVSVEHPYLRGWFPLRDGRNLSINHIVWYMAGTRHVIGNHNGVTDEPFIELMLTNGATVVLDDPTDRENFAKLVGNVA